MDNPTTGGQADSSTLSRQKVWDIPTRLFHWALATTVLAGWYFGEFRTFTTIEWHFYLGYATIGLLVFRILWGFVGPVSARFSTIFASLKHLIPYMRKIARREPSGVAGHNPLGGLSVLALLAVLTVQTTTGLFAEDDAFFASGPLSSHARSDWVLWANQIHHQSSRILLILVGLHLCAILFYHVWKRENLIGPMVTGWKWVRPSKH
ncbi:MAG: cytochrome b/b6 domain-containing protein [Pseudomonadota bacterium]